MEQSEKIPDMTPQEWFEEGSIFTLEFLNEEEREVIYKIMDLYSLGKTRVKDQRIKELEDELKRLYEKHGYESINQLLKL